MQLTKFGVNAALQLTSLRALKVLMILAENSDSDGECTLTLVNIADKINITHKSNISVALSELESLDFIAIDNTKRNNTYILNPDYFVTQSTYPIVLKRFKTMKKENRHLIDDNVFDFDKILSDIKTYRGGF